MSKYTPWSPEQAEKWAKEARLREEINHLVDKAAFDLGFKLALARAAEMIEVRDEEFYVREIEKWQFAWMNVTGTTEEDSKNYRERSRGIDANMRYDLARRLVGVRPIERSDK